MAGGLGSTLLHHTNRADFGTRTLTKEIHVNTHITDFEDTLPVDDSDEHGND